MAKKVVSLPIPSQVGALDPIQLGAIVRAQRTRSGLGIHETAALCGVTVKTLSALEKAGAEVHLGKALHICRCLGIYLHVVPNQVD